MENKTLLIGYIDFSECLEDHAIESGPEEARKARLLHERESYARDFKGHARSPSEPSNDMSLEAFVTSKQLSRNVALH